MKLIDKDALVAGIERRKQQYEKWKNSCKGIEALTASMAIQEDINILYLLNTLEVKEVDLEKEIERLREHEIKWMDKQGFTDYHTGARDAYTKILESLYKDLKN